MPFIISLRSRLLMVVVGTVLASMALLLVTALQQRHRALDDGTDEALRMSRMAAAYDHQSVEGARQLLLSLAHTPEIQHLDDLESSRLFRSLMRDRSPYSLVAVADVGGRVFASSRALPKVVDESDKRWFKRALRSKNMVVGEYQPDPVSGRPTFTCALTARDSMGSARAVVFVGMDLDGFTRLAEHVRLPKEASLVLLDGEGVVVNRWPPEKGWEGKHMLAPGDVALGIATGQRTAVLRGPDGIEHVFGFTALGDGAERSMLVGVGLPKEALSAVAARELWASLALLALIGTLISLISWRVLGEMVLRPIDAMVHATHRVRAGDFHRPFEGVRLQGELAHLASAFDEMAVSLSDQRAQQEIMEQRLREMSLVDELTGLSNRRAFSAFARQQVRHARRKGSTVTLLYMDLDGFKEWNDTYGHAQGDRALVAFARALRGTYRESDVMARLGGDEFAVLTVEQPPGSPARLLERLRLALMLESRAAKFEQDLRFSVGWAQAAAGDHGTIESLMLRADNRMYAAKRARRAVLERQAV
ncbi:MAG: diguanylate cyclase [Candidatus Eisenbacteria bacterium]